MGSQGLTVTLFGRTQILPEAVRFAA